MSRSRATGAAQRQRRGAAKRPGRQLRTLALRASQCKRVDPIRCGRQTQNLGIAAATWSLKR
eukprot:3549095-Rhodomonas_salina.2